MRHKYQRSTGDQHDREEHYHCKTECLSQVEPIYMPSLRAKKWTEKAVNEALKDVLTPRGY